MKHMVIPALAFAVLNSTMHAMEKIKELVFLVEVPSIIQPSKLTDEQKAMMLPHYKAFCARRLAESIESAQWYGLPTGLLSLGGAAYSHRLMKKAYKEIFKREANDAAQPSRRIRTMFRRFTPSSKILCGSPLIGMSYFVGLYAANYAKNVLWNGYKDRCAKADDLTYLNEDLYEQMGKPRVGSCVIWQHEQEGDALLWQMAYRDTILSRDVDFLLNEVDLEMALNGELKASHLTVPLSHCYAPSVSS